MRPRLPLPGPMFLMAVLLISACNNPSPPSVPKETPKPQPAVLKLVDQDPREISAEQLALIGKGLVFGTENPVFGKGSVPIGKSQCALCHSFLPEQHADRGPILVGIAALSHDRVKEIGIRGMQIDFQMESRIPG